MFAGSEMTFFTTAGCTPSQFAQGADLWLNTCKYTPFQLTVFLVGCFLWVVAYIAVIRHAFQQQFLMIPAGAVCANFAWEILWGFFFKPDLGFVVWWGYKTWGILDIGIVYLLFKYGRKQLITENGQAYFVPTILFGLVSWFCTLYFFIHDGYDTSIGANSAYIVNVVMSALYIVLVAKHPDIRKFSFRIAWTQVYWHCFNHHLHVRRAAHDARHG